MELGDASHSHPSTFPASTRGWPQRGSTCLTLGASRACGWCRTQRGKQFQPRSCASKPYGREGRREGAAVLPWRKGSS